MTKKDYIALAAVIASHGHDTGFCRTMAKLISDIASRENPRFDRAKFYQACHCSMATDGLSHDELTLLASIHNRFTGGGPWAEAETFSLLMPVHMKRCAAKARPLLAEAGIATLDSAFAKLGLA